MEGEMNQKHPGDPMLGRGILIGLVGGVAGAIAMDLVMAVEFSFGGLPLTTNYAVIGSVVGAGVPLGIVIYHLMGTALGVGFGLLVILVNPLRIRSVSKGVLLGVAAGVVTIPLGCISVAQITGIPVLRFVGVSTAPHLIWGVAIGIIAGYELRWTEAN